MFETELSNKLKAIFSVKKISYDAPGESQEQDCLFIEIEEPKFSFKDGRIKAMVTGNAIMFGRNEDLKFGFFSKAIAGASKDLTKDLFFSDFESNTQRFRDIVQRGFSFTYFFNSQYDPAIGTITSVDTNIEES
jgi:hypothetical protein